MATEIPAGFVIDEFVCAGAKQYGIRLKKIEALTDDDDDDDDGESSQKFEYILKLRGFCLNFQSSLVLNYKSFKKQVMEFARGNLHEKPIGVTYPNFIRPDIRTGTVTSSPLTKFYKPVLSKGILGPDFRVRNFGDKTADETP